jgi:hypothetical protein
MAVFDINPPGWRIKLYCRLLLPVLYWKAHEAIISHEEIVKAKASKRDTPSAKRKYRLARAQRRNHPARIATQDSKYKGLVKRSVKKPPNIDHERYEGLVSRMTLAEEDENDDDFEPEEEQPLSAESDDDFDDSTLVARYEKHNLRCAVPELSAAADAMEAPEISASEDDDHYFVLHAEDKFEETDRTDLE